MEKNQNGLAFYKKNKKVGYLKTINGTLTFKYDSSWDEKAISEHLPLDGSADDSAVRAWFGEMLPGSRRRHAFETLTKLSLDKIDQFLAWYGEDLPGDLSTSPQCEAKPLKDITGFLKNIISFGSTLDTASFKLSLAGAEPKTAVIVKELNGNIAFYAPSSAYPSSHILKASTYLTALEDHSTTFASLCNIFPVSQIKPICLEEMPFLLIRRFDREIGENGNIERIQQEDFCQAIGNKIRYGKDENGIEIEDIAKIILKRLSEEDKNNFLKMTIFSMLIGNSDDHAGNYAMLLKEKKWKLAPAYDIVSGATIHNMARAEIANVHPAFAFMDLEQARKFGTHRNPFEINSDDMLTMSQIFKINKDDIKNIIDDCICATKNALTRIVDIQSEKWNQLPIKKSQLDFALISLNFFYETVHERVKTLEKIFNKATNDLKNPINNSIQNANDNSLKNKGQIEDIVIVSNQNTCKKNVKKYPKSNLKM